MTLKPQGNLAQKSREARGLHRALAALLMSLPIWVPAPLATDSPLPPQPRPPEILAPELPNTPAAGKGRLALRIGGNRRWCTYPDDRLVQPPRRPGVNQKQGNRNEVFTFGYQFTIAAMKRGEADLPLMLFESPIFRTASWLPASKAGESKKGPPAGKLIIAEGDTLPKAKPTPKGADTLVPFWHENFRCVTLPDHMDFDLDPGTYDIYVAFDLLNRDGGWVHRTVGYLTDVPLLEARRTRLDGIVNIAAGSERQAELQTAVVEPEAAPSPGATDP